jgi:Putative DNA-binding domain
MADAVWAASVRDVFDAPVDEVSLEHIERLVREQARELAELDFKATLYGNGDSDKRELCKDIAAMRNDRGGVIVLGVADTNGVAVGCPEVSLSDAEERRMVQVVASGTQPYAAFDIHPVEGRTAGKGFYLLIAAPSPFRPHAVVVGDGFRYPRRAGATTRYLSETEVADMYRDRFRGEKQQIDRLAQITDEAIAQLDKGGKAQTLDIDAARRRGWLVVSLVPNSPGSMAMSFTARAEIEQWARADHSAQDLIDGFFDLPPTASAGVERYALKGPADAGKPANYPNAVCYTDGAATAAVPLHFATQGTSRPVLLGSMLLFAMTQTLRLVGRHALHNAGARGEAAVEARIMGPDMVLGYTHSGGLVEAYSSELLVQEARSRRTLPLTSLANAPQELFIATRMMLTDVFNAFGQAEVPQIASDGTLRLRYFPAAHNVKAVAEQRGVDITEETVPE